MSRAGVSAKWDNDFEPYENRNPEEGLTHSESLMNLIKGSLGTGIFAIPEAFYLVGMVNGVIGYLFVSLFSIYCFRIMVRSQYFLCKYKKVGLLTFSESMEVAFEVGPEIFNRYTRFAWHLTNILVTVLQFGVLCVYVIFISENIKSVGDQYSEKPINLYVYMVLVVVPCASIICIRNIKIFSPFALFANIITFVTLAVLGFYVSKDLPEITSRKAFNRNLRHYPCAFGTALFSIHSLPVITSVENAMQDAKHFLAPFGTLNVGLSIVLTINLLVGVMGYWRYGEDIESTILLNFPPHDITTQIIESLYSLALVISFGLQGIIPVGIIWKNYIFPRLQENEVSKSKVTLIDYVLRLAMCLTTFLISVNIPLLGTIISFVGGVCLSIIGIIFPALLEVCALWPDGFGKFRWIFWKDVLIIFVGIFGFTFTMFSSLSDIVIQLSQRSSFDK